MLLCALCIVVECSCLMLLFDVMRCCALLDSVRCIELRVFGLLFFSVFGIACRGFVD